MQKIFITGDRRTGKSTFISTFLNRLGLTYVGLFSLRLMRGDEITGYGLRFGNEPEVRIFAELSDTPDFDRFRINLRVFETAAEFIRTALQKPPELFVIDELGVIEQRCAAYCEAVEQLLSSPVRACLVVQQRALPFWTSLFSAGRPEVLTLETENRQAVAEQLQILLGISRQQNSSVFLK